MPLDPECWVDDYGDYLLRYAVSRLRNRDAAEDVLQETLLAAFRASDQYAGRGSERGWLLGILKRKIVDHVRSRSREQAESQIEDDIEEALFHAGGKWRESPAVFGETPHASVERGEFWEKLSGCLDNLPQKQQNVFVLRELEQLDSDRICTLLELSASNLGVLLHRARLRLASCLRVNWSRVGE